MTQKTGALIFDETADRYDIRFDLNDYYGVRGQLVSCRCEGFGFERAAGAYLKAA